MTIRDTFAEVRAEAEAATSVDVEDAQPASETEAPTPVEQVPDAALEQPAADDGGFSDEDIALSEELLLAATETSQNGSESGGITPGSDDFWNLGVEVKTADGPTEITVREATDGYMRQDDYTRKTQALAEKSKRLDRAEQFLTEFESNPREFARSLAVQAGWITADDHPVSEFKAAHIPTPDDLEQQVNQMVEERIAQDPRVTEARKLNAQAQVTAEFDRLEKHYQIPLPQTVRDSIAEEAIRTRSSDLEGILARRIVQARTREGNASALRAAAPSRPGSAPPVEDEPTEDHSNLSIKELYQVVKAEAQTQ